MRHASALQLAESLVETFRPVCHRIEIKGSLCRMKPEVKDIDLLLIPDLTPPARQRPEFGKPIPPIYKTQLDQVIARMRDAGDILMEKNGEHLKRFMLRYAAISVELYLVLPPATWGVRSVIRTGPADFSHWMVTRQVQGGALPDTYYVENGAVWESVSGSCFDTPEEIDYFRLCGLGWIEPKDRVAKWSHPTRQGRGVVEDESEMRL